MMFLSFILAAVSVAHVSAANEAKVNNFDTALILKQYNSTTGERDQVVLLRKDNRFFLPGAGGDNNYTTNESDYASALVHRFLEDTGLETFPTLTKVKSFDYKRNNRHPIRIYEAETTDSLRDLNKIKTDNPTGRYGFTSHIETALRNRLHNQNYRPLGTVNGQLTTTHLKAAHVRWILRLHDNNTLDDKKDTEALAAFAGASLVNNKVVKAQSEEPVEEPVEEPPVVEGPTQAELAQQEAQRLAAANQANANANNATTGNATATTEGEDKKDEKKKSLAWLWITLAVVGVLAIAVTAYCCMSGDSTPEQEELV